MKNRLKIFIKTNQLFYKNRPIYFIKQLSPKPIILQDGPYDKKKLVYKVSHGHSLQYPLPYRSGTPSKCTGKKGGVIELTHLEQFILNICVDICIDICVDICESIENCNSLRPEHIEHANAMDQVLKHSLQEVPNFSFDFYAIVSNLLNDIEKNKSCDNYFIKLAEYLEQCPEL